MTEQEKKELLDELEKRMDEKYKGCLTREDVATTLKAPREKWFKDEDGGGSNSLMSKAFDSSIISWQVWETIRKLTCVVCGKQYVRQLANVENADEIAEKLCQFVYDLKMEFKKHKVLDMIQEAYVEYKITRTFLTGFTGHRAIVESNDIYVNGFKELAEGFKKNMVFQMPEDSEVEV